MADHRTPDDPDVDDAFRSILEGLRTTLPGVQVLFAFLLTLPFTSRFGELRGIERAVYYVAFFSSAVASVLLIAPSAHQRLRAPASGVRRRSQAHLLATVRITIAGTVVFVIALTSAVYLVSTIVFEDVAAAVATAAVAVLILWAWFYVPLVSFNRDHES
jgi:hypothetical protein